MKLKENIKANFVDKGEVKENLHQIETIDMTGHYERNRNFAGSLGGQLMQLAIIMKTVQDHSEKQQTEGPVSERTQNKKSLKDLISRSGLFNFMLNYLKDMRNDSLSIMISHDTAAYLEQAKVGLNEIHKLSEE